VTPAYFETNLIQAENLKQSFYIPSFEAHFVTLKQLFLSRFWGYGSSTWGENDGLSFQVGWPHWWLAAGSFLILSATVLIGIFKKKFKIKKELPRLLNIAFLFLILILSLFMTHNKSTFVWKYINIVQYAQFPWRFLGVSILAVSILGGFFITFFSKKIRTLLLIILCAITIVLNFNYFKPEIFYKDRSDKDYFSGSLWEYQYQGAIYDYLPKTAVLPQKSAPATPIVVSGEAEINDFNKLSKYWEFQIDSKDNSKVTVPVFDFPNWTVFIDDKEVPHSIDKNTGSILIEVGSGKNKIQGYFRNTFIRTLSNTISLLSLVVLINYLVKLKKLKKV